MTVFKCEHLFQHLCCLVTFALQFIVWMVYHRVTCQLCKLLPHPPLSPGGCFAWTCGRNTACLQGGCLHLRTYLHSSVPWMSWTWPDLQTTPFCWRRSWSGYVLPWPYCIASSFSNLNGRPKQHPAMSKSNIPFSWGWAQKNFSSRSPVLLY